MQRCLPCATSKSSLKQRRLQASDNEVDALKLVTCFGARVVTQEGNPEYGVPRAGLQPELAGGNRALLSRVIQESGIISLSHCFSGGADDPTRAGARCTSNASEH